MPKLKDDKDTIKKKVLKTLVTQMGNVSKACKAANISRAYYYTLLKEDDDFKEAVSEVKESCIDLAESELLNLIKDKNTTAIIFYLKTKGKQRGYIEKQELSHSGKVDLIDFSK